MSREILFQYLCKHSHNGRNAFYSRNYTLAEVENTCDIIEDIAINACDGCGGNCTTESCNHCECDSVLDYGEFEIVARRQYTGLRDINGVKIFEGDIVRDHVGVGEVKYSETRAAFKVSYRDGYAKWFIDYTLKGERESIEVIGNIHQHPELLNNKA